MKHTNTYRKIIFILFLWLTSFFAFMSMTHASSYVYAKIGEKLTLDIENSDSKSDITWVISQDGSILDTLKKSK